MIIVHNELASNQGDCLGLAWCRRIQRARSPLAYFNRSFVGSIGLDLAGSQSHLETGVVERGSGVGVPKHPLLAIV